MAKVFIITEGLENMGALKTGGQGSVYKGRRTGAIITAVKILPTPIYSESLNDRHFTDFQNEVEKLKKVNETPNPNVVKILNSGITESGSFPFIEMEFIEGPDLEELLKPPHDPVFTIKEIIKIAEQLSSALAHCHSVDVRHGDIKSNNVKFNLYTGNYVLLDFGLAIMSDEQRRTSLRNAGAIEFMAPEQNEGIMLFQSDVYSFGVILFELLAGTAPFPLHEQTETARNLVRIAHMETTPPDVLIVRQQNLPLAWSKEKKDHEMQVPEWIVSMIYKCLEKKPEARFANGIQLHEYIVLNNNLSTYKNEGIAEQINLLQQGHEKLIREKEQLQEVLLQYQHSFGAQEPLLNSLKNKAEEEGASILSKTKTSRIKRWRTGIVIAALVISASVFALLRSNNNQTVAGKNVVTPTQPLKYIIGQYKVTTPRAYFYNGPDAATRRTAYMIPSNDVVTAYDEKNGFIYTEFTNSRGQTSKGWLRQQDLISLEKWSSQNNEPNPQVRLTEQDINSQLNEARELLANHRYKEAVYIYSYLVQQQVPEAMYQYGNLTLQNQNDAVNCSQALALLEEAGNKGFAPAKRTLGFLYLFAQNKDVLQMSNYNHCTYEKKFSQGVKLLTESAAAGDSVAQQLVRELKLKNN